jgi:mRNA interferase MazF
MTEGDVVLTPLPQADGRLKNRPAVILRRMPPFGDVLVCGINTQLHLCVTSFDELIQAKDSDFAASGLKSSSLIRLGYLACLPAKSFIGRIGKVSDDRHRRLLERLCRYLSPTPE